MFGLSPTPLHRPQVATYNVGGKKPHPGIRLDDWLGPGAAGAGAGARVPPQAGPAAAAAAPGGADVVAVGFQELVPLNAGSVMGGGWALASGLGGSGRAMAEWAVSCSRGTDHDRDLNPHFMWQHRTRANQRCPRHLLYTHCSAALPFSPGQ